MVKQEVLVREYKTKVWSETTRKEIIKLRNKNDNIVRNREEIIKRTEEFYKYL